jgi:hypothetical protein
MNADRIRLRDGSPSRIPTTRRIVLSHARPEAAAALPYWRQGKAKQLSTAVRTRREYGTPEPNAAVCGCKLIARGGYHPSVCLDREGTAGSRNT